jgi:hypothetical protein
MHIYSSRAEIVHYGVSDEILTHRVYTSNSYRERQVDTGFFSSLYSVIDCSSSLREGVSWFKIHITLGYLERSATKRAIRSWSRTLETSLPEEQGGEYKGSRRDLHRPVRPLFGGECSYKKREDAPSPAGGVSYAGVTHRLEV